MNSMIKVICDKCKRDIDRNSRCVLGVTGVEKAQTYDLCRECIEKIENFITDYEVTKADEYKKGYHDGFADGKEELWWTQWAPICERGDNNA